MDKDFEVLKMVAKRLADERTISKYVRCGHVACALLTDQGNAKCGIGFWAEHAAISDMLKAGETKIVKLVSASKNAVVVSCGRCLEFIRQVDEANIRTKILLPNDFVKTVDELLPVRWDYDDL